jgi:GNAT superfamily N-acetyltransferase
MGADTGGDLSRFLTGSAVTIEGRPGVPVPTTDLLAGIVDEFMSVNSGAGIPDSQGAAESSFVDYAAEELMAEPHKIGLYRQTTGHGQVLYAGDMLSTYNLTNMVGLIGEHLGTTAASAFKGLFIYFDMPEVMGSMGQMVLSSKTGPDGTRTCYVESVFVRGEFRGRGIGAELYMNAEVVARQQGFGRMEALVVENLDIQSRILIALGWVDQGMDMWGGHTFIKELK